MTIKRIKTGLPFLDDAVGGLYLGLPTLVKGARNSGKTVLAAHFVDRVLRIGEKALLFCETAPEAAILEARSAGIDFESAARSGQLLLIPIHDAMESARGGFPFDAAIAELHSLVSRSSVGFAVFSSVVPWLAATPASDMPSRADEFLSTLDSLSLTSLLLVHRPVSAPADRLVEKLSSACPVVLEMEAFESAQRELRVIKYDGRDDLHLPVVFPLDLVPGKGLVAARPMDAAATAPAPEVGPAAPAPVAPHARRHTTLFTAQPPPAADAASPAAPQHRRAALFPASSAPVSISTPVPAPEPTAPSPAVDPVPTAPPQPRRATLFSAVVKPEHMSQNTEPGKPMSESEPPQGGSSRIRFSAVIH